MKFKKLLAFGVCTLMIFALFAGCGGNKQAVKVKLCEVTHSVFYAPQYIAIEKGFFEEVGIEIELTNGQGADKVMSAVLSGNADIGFAGPEASIYVYNEGKDDYTKVFAQATKCDGSFLVSREDITDFKWSSLKGTHVLPGRKGGVPYMALEYAIRQNGLDPYADLNLDNSIQFGLMAGAFAAGTGDFVTLFEPTASALVKEGKGYIVASVGKEAGDMPYTAYFAKSSYIDKNKDLIQRFTNAVAKGQRWVAEHTPKQIAAELKGSFPDTDEDILTSAIARYKEIGAYSETPVMTKESFELLQTVMTSAGELKQTAPFDKIVDNSFAEKAIK